jgi:hypothetical protein
VIISVPLNYPVVPRVVSVRLHIDRLDTWTIPIQAVEYVERIEVMQDQVGRPEAFLVFRIDTEGCGEIGRIVCFLRLKIGD